MLLMFLTVTFVTALPHSFSLLLCLSPILTSLLSHFFPKSPISSFCFSSLPFCSYPYFPPAQCSGERLPQQQGSSHESKPWLQLDPWQRWWSGVQELPFRPPCKSTELPVPTTSPPSIHAHELCLLPSPYSCEYSRLLISPRSSVSSNLCAVLMSSNASSLSLSCFVFPVFLSFSLSGVHQWLHLSEKLLCTQHILFLPLLPPLLSPSLPFNLSPSFPHSFLPSPHCVYHFLPPFLPPTFLRFISSFHPHSPCNLICFSFIHLLHRQCNERLIEVETLLDGFPCHYPWN